MNDRQRVGTIHRICASDANCYLVETGEGFVLIDSGWSTERAELTRDLEAAGCLPGRLQLVVLTHGDIDHAGNCAYLREAYGAAIAMHPGDVDLVARGMEPRREWGSRLLGVIMGGVASLSHRDVSMADFERFSPDVLVEEGNSLSPYGFEAQVLHTPGHTRGSICVLTAGGDLFSGDTLMNARRWLLLGSLAEDHEALVASLDRLLDLPVETVYPGHLKPFAMAQYARKNRSGRSRQLAAGSGPD
jgi:glyoxylase-like metal-dependent hydrolase (beta-lactamase superfamily II)